MRVVPPIRPIREGTILDVNLINQIINRTEHGADLLSRYKMVAGSNVYVEQTENGLGVSYLTALAGGAGTGSGGAGTGSGGAGTGTGGAGTGNGGAGTPEPVIYSINWETEQSGIIGSGGWQITNNGNTIRFNVEDSANCGGLNANIQSGTATAIINVTGKTKIMAVSLSGLGELQAANFEVMKLTLDGILIISSTSPGTAGGCLSGPVVVSTLVNGPYLLPVGIHTLTLTFSTVDRLFHKGAFYLCQLTFS